MGAENTKLLLYVFDTYMYVSVVTYMRTKLCTVTIVMGIPHPIP